MIWRGQRVRNVAHPFSRERQPESDQARACRVDFNRYTTEPALPGLQVARPRQRLAGSFADPRSARDVGLPADGHRRRLANRSPRLYINNEYQGLYALVEPIDDGVRAAHVQRELAAISSSTGYGCPFYTEYLGDDLTPTSRCSSRRTTSSSRTRRCTDRLRDLFRDVNGPDDAVWREPGRATRIDLAQFMTHVAIQRLPRRERRHPGLRRASTTSTCTGLPAPTRHRLIPWDEDFAFTFIGSSLFRRGEQPVVLFERAFAEPDLRALFLDVAESLRATRSPRTGWLSDELERLAALITPAVLRGHAQAVSNETFFAIWTSSGRSRRADVFVLTEVST